MPLPTKPFSFVFHPYLGQDLPHRDDHFHGLCWYPSHDAIHDSSPGASYVHMQHVPDDYNPNSQSQHGEHSGDCSAN